MDESEATIDRIKVYSESDAKGIGRLMPFLSDKLTDAPMAKDLLEEIINSPHYEQLVARLDSIIVGTATLSIVMGPAVGREAYLEDFVTDPSVRGQGIGDKIWNEMVRWCEERGIDLSFTSNSAREAAHRFYYAHGAEVRDTTVFHVDIKK